MNISRLFLLAGAVYLVIGIAMGMHMAAGQDFTLAPVHAHINLLGFTLMTLFGIAYRVLPALAGNVLGKVHFWLHQLGALVLLIALFLMMSGMVPMDKVEVVLAASSGVVFLGALAWALNVFRNA